VIDNQADKKDDQQGSWLDIISLVLSFSGAILTYLTQAQNPEASLWPLPGLVLIDWVLIGLVGFSTTYFYFRRISTKWLHVAWLITGMFIPLIILGAFSIGAGVLIAFIMFVVSTIMITIRQRGKLLASFGLLMVGSICNLGVLLILITLSYQS
jgi:hypothetical protein